MFLEPPQAARRESLIQSIGFCKYLVISVKTMQETAAVNRLLVDEFVLMVESGRMLDGEGRFRKSLLGVQADKVTEYFNKVKVD